MKILVVDDDPAQLLLSSIALRDLGGFDVVVANCGAEAMERARQDSPDVILMDMMLEDIDGPEIFVRLRGDRTTDKIPVIFHTARVDPSERSELLSLGATGFIGKPFDPAQLAHEVRRILQSRS
jgi:two-component system, OmpR family, response regulator